PAPAEPAPTPVAVQPAPPPAKPPMNPFFEASTLPYHLPPFDKIKDDDYAPAFERGMAEQRKEADAIAHDSAAPTFDNTIVALEKSGRLLTRVSKSFFNLNQSNGNDAMQKVEADITPKLAAHNDAILLDTALFARVDAVYQKRATL